METSKRSQVVIKLGILFVYLVLALGLTYPVIIQVNQEIAGMGSDSHQIINSVINRLNNYAELGSLSILWDIVSKIKVDTISIITLLSYCFNPTLSYNLYWLFSFVISAFGAYLLTYYILATSRSSQESNKTYSFGYHLPALVAGLIYSFSPVHVAWAMGFRGATHIEWIPLTTLFILKFIKKPNFRYFFLSLMFFLLLVQGEHHFAAFYFIFLIPFLGYYLYKNSHIFKNKKFRIYAIVAIILGALITLWLYQPLINVATSDYNYLDPGIDQATTYSNDALSIITPPFTNNFWGEFFAPIREKFTGNEVEYSAYIGIAVIFLTVLVFIYKKSKDSIFWALSAVGFYILSMGPFLHFSGTIEPKIPLPYLLLYHYIPFFRNIRAVDRFAVISILCFSITAGFAIHYYLEKYKGKLTTKIIFPAAVIGVIIFEYLPVPVLTNSLDYSPFYDQIKEEPGDFSIIEIPGATNYRAATRVSYYQSIHQKEMINNYQTARVNKDNPKLVRNQSVPILKQLLYKLPKETEYFDSSAISTTNKMNNTAILNYYKVKYIILHKNFIGDGDDEIKLNDFIGLNNFIKNYTSASEYYQDQDLIVYKLNNEPNRRAPILKTETNWQQPKNSNGYVKQSITDPATLVLDNIYNQERVYLTFNAKANPKTARILKIELNGQTVHEFVIDDKSRHYQVPLLSLNEGENEIKFKVFDSNRQVITLRKISTLSFSNITTKPIPDEEIKKPYESLIEDETVTTILQIPFHSYYRVKSLSDKNILSAKDFLVTDPFTNRAYVKRNLPVYKELLFATSFDKKTLNSGHDIISLPYYEELWQAIFSQSDISHIVIHKDLIPSKDIKPLTEFLESRLDLILIRSTDYFIIYKVSPKPITIVPIVINEASWDALERVGEAVQVRKMDNDSTIEIFNPFPEKLPSDLVFDVRTCSNTTRNLKIYNQYIQTHEIDINWPDFQKVRLPFTLNPGNNTILLKLYDEQGNYLKGEELKECPLWFTEISLDY